MDDSLGRQLRHLRDDRGMSLSQLARLSGVGKGTISELENDRRGARLDTLFALTTALGAPLGALLAKRSETAGPLIAGTSVTAVLLDRWVNDFGSVELYRATLSTDRQLSAAHAAGTQETVTVVQGHVLVGPAGAERELREGDSLRYAGGEPHHFQALGAPAQVVLLMHYPDPITSKEQDPR